MCEEAAMEKFLSEGSLASNDLAQMIAKRELFPCYFGSALKVQGCGRTVRRTLRIWQDTLSIRINLVLKSLRLQEKNRETG